MLFINMTKEELDEYLSGKKSKAKKNRSKFIKAFEELMNGF